MMENTNQPDREGFHAMPKQKMSWPWGTVLWAILLFATGGVAGGAYHQMVQHHRLPHGSSISPVPLFAQRLRKDLALSEEQVRSIETIVAKYEPRFQRISQNARGELLADLQQMNAEIVPLLTEKQRVDHEIRWNRMLQR